MILWNVTREIVTAANKWVKRFFFIKMNYKKNKNLNFSWNIRKSQKMS